MNGDWDRLLRYLRNEWNTRSLGLVREPQHIVGGFGRRSWLIELDAPEWQMSRSVQIRCSDPGKASLGLEVERLRWLAARSFPVSPPLLWEDDPAILGEPFALLSWVPGRTMAERIRTDGWQSAGGDGVTIGLLLARLHAIAVDDFPSETQFARGSTLDRISALLGSGRTDALATWLHYHRPVSSDSVACHLDLHPLNVVLSPNGPVVIDWELARVDHSVMDLAMSQVHTEIAIGIGEYPRMDDRSDFSGNVLRAYRTVRSVDEAELAYFRTLAACRRLGDVAGALQRPGLQSTNRTELKREAAAATAIIDQEIGWHARS